MKNSLVISHVVARSRQAGVSVMETILFLLVAVVFLVGLFALFQQGFGSAKVKTETDYVQALSAAVLEMYGTSRDFGTAAITPTLVSTRAAPAPMIVGTGLRNGWNGAVTVTGAGDVFTIQSANIPEKECTSLVQVRINPVAVRINGAAQTLPLTAAAVAAACTDAANTLAWDLR
jgi:hypothetical protein